MRGRHDPPVSGLMMRHRGLLCLAGLIGVLASLLPGSAAAEERFAPHQHVTTVPPRQVFVSPISPRPDTRPFFRHPAVPYIVYPSPAYDYTPPAIVYDQPSPTVIVSPAPPPPTPSVIEYPNGRYELQGDGITTRYRWVWMPTVPPPPGPPETPQARPPSAGPPAPTESTKEQPLAPHRDIYRWMDEEGVTHWTDQLESIPQPYRSKAQRPTLAGR